MSPNYGSKASCRAKTLRSETGGSDIRTLPARLRDPGDKSGIPDGHTVPPQSPWAIPRHTLRAERYRAGYCAG